MQIVHRVSINATPAILRELAELRVLPQSPDGLASSRMLTFEVDEAHENWREFQGWLARYQPLDIVSTNFSKKELSAASWLQLETTWHHGYPQPKELELGYLEATYDLSNFCRQCGIGLRQKGPFQLKGEPKWGRNGMLQLNWVFDEFFVRPEIWKGVFEPHGIACRAVTNTSGQTLQSVVQLVATEEVDVDASGLPSEVCTACKRTKYLPVSRGRFPALRDTPSTSLVRTRQRFGSGASAPSCMLAAATLRASLEAEKVKGFTLRPLTESQEPRA